MADRDIKFRIGVDGSADGKRTLSDFGSAGAAAYSQIGKASDSAGAAADAADARVRKISDTFNSARDSFTAFDREFATWTKLADAAQTAAARDAAQRAADLRNITFSQSVGVTEDPKGAIAGQSAKVFQDEAQALKDVETRAAAVRAQIDPLGVAQNKLNAELANYRDLAERGRISTTELAAAELQANNRYRQTAESLGALGDGGRLAGYQVTNLGYQLNDVFVSLASGQAPLRVFIQQGTQIAQIFAGSGRGVGSILQELAGRALGLVTPFRLASAGIVGAVAIIGYAYDQWIDKQNQLERALSGNGRGSGATIDDINGIAEAASNASRVSVSSARDIAAAFASTGQVGVSNFAELTLATQRFATTTGSSLDDAKKELVGAFGNPDLLAGIDQVNQKVNFLDEKTREYIRTLIDENDRQGAIKAALDALIPKLDNVGDHTTILGRIWKSLGDGASNALDAIGRAVDGAGLAQKITKLQTDLTVATATGASSVAIQSIRNDLAAAQAEFNKLHNDAKAASDAQIASNASLIAAEVARSLEPNAALLRTLQDQQSKLSKAINDPEGAKALGTSLDLAKDRYDAVTRAIGTLVDAHGQLITAEDVQIQKEQLAAQLAALPNDKAHAAQREEIAEKQKSLDLIGKVITSTQAETEVKEAGSKAYNEASQHIDKNTSAIDRNNKLVLAQTNGELALAEAYLQSGEAAAKKQATLKALTEQAKDGVDVKTRARQDLAAEVAQTAVAGAREVDALTAHAAAQDRVTTEVQRGQLTTEQANQEMTKELALRPLLIAQSVAEGKAKTDLAEIIKRLSDAYDDDAAAQRRSQVEGAINDQKIGIDLLQQELGLNVANDNQRQVEIAKLQAIADLKREGVDITSEEGQQYIANAAVIATMNQQLERINASRQEVISTFDTIASDWTNFISEGKFGWDDWKNFGLSALKDIETEIFKLAAINPLKNALFGQSNPTLDSVGGIIGALGGGSAASGGGATIGLPSISPDIGAISSFTPFIVDTFHSGGMVGGPAITRRVPESIMRSARRFHSGAYLASDEVPAILQTGERVLNRQEAAAYHAGQSGQAKILVQVQLTGDGAKNATGSAQVVNSGGMDIQASLDTVMARILGDPNSQSRRALRDRTGVSSKLTAR